MGTTATKEEEATKLENPVETILNTELIKSEEDIKPTENVGKNKIISLLGLDDHEKYFESTDSDISELNDEKKKEGEILYFNEATFQSNSTIKPNDYCMKSRCGARSPKQGDFINIIDGINVNEMKDEDCEMDCPSRFSNNKNIKINCPPPFRSAPCSFPQPDCNSTTCPTWKKLQSECPNKCCPSTCPGSNMETNKCPQSVTSKKVSSEDVPNIRRNSSSRNNSSKKCNDSSCITQERKVSLPSQKPTCCLRPDTCTRINQKNNNTASRAKQIPLTDTTYSQRQEAPIVSRSAPQQRIINGDKHLATTNQHATDYLVPQVPKKMQDTGTNTSITEGPIAFDNSKDPHKSSKSNPTIPPSQSKAETPNHNRKNKKPNSTKHSTSYTYDEQTTDTSGYTNYETETPNSTYSSDSPYEQMHDYRCPCQCMQCQYEFYINNNNTGQVQEISDDLCSNFSDRSNRSEYINLAYQKNGKYPVLVNELESTLSQRNRTRVHRTMQQFEVLSNRNNSSENPTFNDYGSHYDAYRVKCYEKEYCCQKCHKALQERRQKFESAESKLPMRNCAANEQNSNNLADSLKEFIPVNETTKEYDNFKLTPFANGSAKFAEQHSELKSQNFTKTSSKNGIKNGGWKINPNTGDWEKVKQWENYDCSRKPMQNPHTSTLSKNQHHNYPNDHKVTPINPSSCMCRNCQHH